MSTWRIKYQGKPDPRSKAGYAQPSWHTFDSRIWWWEAANLEIQLTNLQAKPPPAGKIAFYRVQLRVLGSKEIIRDEYGSDWQKLVRNAKKCGADAYADEKQRDIPSTRTFKPKPIRKANLLALGSLVVVSETPTVENHHIVTVCGRTVWSRSGPDRDQILLHANNVAGSIRQQLFRAVCEKG